MNRIYRSIWNDKTGTFVAASENAKTGGRKSSPGAVAGGARFALNGLALSLMLAFGSNVYALPTGGAVSAGSASIAGGAGKTTISQSSQNVAINWQSFSIGQGEAVRFVQPNGNSVALNRVLGADPSSILGSLSANGKVFLLNPNGILFGNGAQVNVGGLVASTLNITDSDFMAGRYNFAGAGNGTILNQGSINADGGYVALLGANVSNQGVISAKLGTVALAAGNAVTLDVAGDGLLSVTVNQGAVNALVQNGGLIQADGGQVLLTAQAAGSLLQSVVNNTGVIQAQTVENHNGTIRLMGGMQGGTVNVSGTLDASAPNGGNGGFIETSAANVNIANGAKVTTAAPMGLTGTFLIDPQDFTIGAGDNIAGTTLSALLVTNSVVITTNTGPAQTDAAGTTPPVSTLNTNAAGAGDIIVNDTVTWSASASPTTLTMNAARDVTVNAAITATKGNLVVCCGRDVNVKAAITTTNGSVLLSAGRDVNMAAAMSTTDGNISICAAHDVNISAALALTRGSSIPAQSLDLPLGLVLTAGLDGHGPGVGGGNVIVTAPVSVTGPNAPVTINYTPVSYTTPIDHSANFTLVTSTLTERMLVFPDASAFDGTAASLSGFKSSATSGTPADVTLVAGPGSTAAIDTAALGPGTTITFTGLSLAGAGADKFALPVSCCAPRVGRTTADIIAVPPVVVPPVVVPPVVVVPPGTPPVATAAVVVASSPLVLNTVVPAPSRGMPGLNLAVVGTGVSMPPILVAETAPVELVPVATVLETPPVQAPAFVAPAEVVPPQAPPQIFVPPQRPRKPDRN